MFYAGEGEEYLIKASPPQRKFHPTPMLCAGRFENHA